jgi:hypothetical protein
MTGRKGDGSMRLEMIRGATNVMRFPLERRLGQSLSLLRSIAPDHREIGALAEAFGVTPPSAELRHVSDAVVANMIRRRVPAFGPEREKALAGVLTRFLDQAFAAFRRADAGLAAAADALERLTVATALGAPRLDPIAELADHFSRAAALLLIHAHIGAEQAEGAARAVDLAQRGETWRPFDLSTEADALFFDKASAS